MTSAKKSSRLVRQLRFFRNGTFVSEATFASESYVYFGIAVVLAVVGQTVGSISSKTLAYDCLYTFELCTASMIANSTRTIRGVSAQCLFVQEFTVLLLTTSLGRAFQAVVILIG